MVKKKAGAPKGNKNAIGYGRPPNPGYTDDDLIILGEELLNWMKKVDEEDLPVWHLSEWYSQLKHIAPSQWESIIKRDCFKWYYERSKVWMGTKMISNKDFPQSYGNRFLRIYFSDVKSLEREDVDYEIEKKREENKITPEVNSALCNVMEYFSKLQNGK